MILVDTSVLIAFLRGDSSSAVDLLAEFERQGVPFAIPAICCAEVLQGAFDEAEWQRLDEYLGTQRIDVCPDPRGEAWAAARLYFDCRRIGLTVRSTIDCQVALAALRNDAPLLQQDADYARIAQVRPLQLLPTR